MLAGYLRVIKHKLTNNLLTFLIVFPMIVKLTILVDPFRVGCDTWTHLYKAHVLKRQIQSLPICLWGAWDWSWHVGYEFLDVYSPLPYYCMVLISMIGLTLETSLGILIAGCILVGAFGMFYLCKEVTQSSILSLLSVILFIYSPTFVIVLTEWGNVGKFFVYVITPLSLLLAIKLAESGEKVQTIKYAFLLGALVALSFLSNIAVGLWVWMMSVVWIMFKPRSFCLNLESIVKTLGATLISVLLSAHFLLPMVCGRATFLPVVSPAKFDISSLKDTLLEMGAFYWVFIGILSIELLRSRRKIDKNLKIFLGFLMFYLLYNLTAIVTEESLPWLSLIRGDRSFIVILTFCSLLPPYLLKMLDIKRRILKIISFIFMGLMIIQGMLIAPYYPLQYEEYFDAAKFIASDPEWCRYAFLPREPIAAVLPRYANKHYVDGWSFLSDPEIFSILGTAVPGFEYTEKIILQNCTAGLKLLTYLGVKYVIVERWDPIYGYDFSNALYSSINASELAVPRYTKGSVTVFEIKDFHPLHVYLEVPKSFNATISQALPLNGNLVIKRMTQTEQELQIDLRVSDSAYVVIPVVNSNKLETYINGEKVETFHAFGNLIAVFLSCSGEYNISIKLKTWQPIRVLGALISFLTLMVGSVYMVFMSRRSKHGKKMFS